MKRIGLVLILAGLLLCVVTTAWGQTDPSCCVGRVGDVNGDNGDDPTIGDISRLVECLFINLSEPFDCLAEADANGSGGSAPTRADITIGDINWLIDYLFITGEGIGLLPCPDPSGDPNGYLFTMSDCKYDFAAASGNAEEDETCIQWTYTNGRLYLTHLNAGFNCCPKTEFNIAVDGNAITITEIETEGLCDCLCLFDIRFVIDNLPADVYTITVVEAYRNPGDPILASVIDLGVHASGLFCRPRTGYPWGTEPFDGFVLGHSGCKSMPATAALSEPGNGETCIRYSYNETTGLLSFNHINAAFNCCPSELLAEFSVDGNTITVTEDENLDMGGCLCLCLFDLDCIIAHVPAGIYQLVIEEKYTATGPPLEFTLDLTGPVTDELFCVPRDGYPWGEM
jgi:hypothetical protein